MQPKALPPLASALPLSLSKLVLQCTNTLLPATALRKPLLAQLHEVQKQGLVLSIQNTVTGLLGSKLYLSGSSSLPLRPPEVPKAVAKLRSRTAVLQGLMRNRRLKDIAET